jgi:hypothetical protein
MKQRKLHPLNGITRWCKLGLLASFALLRSGDASIESTQLREASQSNLLFWSSYDFSVDAAAQLFGPLLFVRGGEAQSTETRKPENDTTRFLEKVVSDKNRMVFSLFQKGDGSEKDPDGIPTRYLRMQNDNREMAVKALEITLQWRKENDIDTLIARPQEKYDICKAVFPHYFAGRDSKGHVILVQRPAMIDLQAGKRNKLSHDDLLMHYVYVNEYMWQVMEASNPMGTMISVLDLTGLNFNVLKQPDLIGFLKKFVSTMDSHYPQRAHKTLILNAPKWFNVMYKVLSPLLRESTKAKIEIYSRGKKQDHALKNYLGDKGKEVLPAGVWSKKEPKDGLYETEKTMNSAEEDELRSFVSFVFAL